MDFTLYVKGKLLISLITFFWTPKISIFLISKFWFLSLIIKVIKNLFNIINKKKMKVFNIPKDLGIIIKILINRTDKDNEKQ